jgi:hypothetical protein
MAIPHDHLALYARIIELWDADCDIDEEIDQLRILLAESEALGVTPSEDHTGQS